MSTDTERDAWLSERRTGLGASEVAAVLGLSPYQTPLHVYLDKVGLGVDRNTRAMQWGLRLEDAIAAGYQERTGKNVGLSPTRIVHHADEPWILATPDRIVVGEPRWLELKTARSDSDSDGKRVWGEEGTDEVPPGYLLQCQWQMLAASHLGVEAVDVAVLIAGSDLRLYTVPRSEDLLTLIVPIARDFWERVQRRQPPEPDWRHADTAKLLSRLYQPMAGVRVELDAFAAIHADCYQLLGRNIRKLEKQREEAKARLTQALGPAAAGQLPDGRLVTRKVVKTKGYTVQPSEYVSLTIKGQRAEEDLS